MGCVTQKLSALRRETDKKTAASELPFLHLKIDQVLLLLEAIIFATLSACAVICISR